MPVELAEDEECERCGFWLTDPEPDDGWLSCWDCGRLLEEV